MNSQKYLQRINFQDKINLDLLTLSKLQFQHLMNVPFENLDIYRNIPIRINFETIFDKIIHQKRGGFCYELNGLFCELLTELGFKTRRISCRVFSETEGYGHEFDHLAILVEFPDGEYLVDVGFGDFTFSPLKFSLNTPIKDHRRTFIFDKKDEDYFRVNQLENEQKTSQYIFKNITRKWTDFSEMCQYHQTSPESHFTKNQLITIPTETGRITLNPDKLTITKGKNKQIIPIETKAVFDEYLWQYFKIQF